MTDTKVWIITGAGRGMGVNIAQAALAAGHCVVATARDAANVVQRWASTPTCWPSPSTSPTPTRSTRP